MSDGPSLISGAVRELIAVLREEVQEIALAFASKVLYLYVAVVRELWRRLEDPVSQDA